MPGSQALNPVSFDWKHPEEGTTTQFGFLAQEVQQIFPNLVHNTGLIATDTPDGMLQLQYNGLFAPIVSSLQEIAKVSGLFRDNIIAWLGSASNGIGALFAKEVHTDKLCVKKSNGDDVCLSGDQLASLLAQQVVPTVSVAPVVDATTVPVVDTVSPVITVSGESTTTNVVE